MKRVAYLYIAVFTGILLFACASTTYITGAWTNPEVQPAPQGYDSIFVAAMTKNINVRTKVENALAAALDNYNKRTLKSTNYFAPNFQETMPSRETMLQKIQSTGAEAILTTSLVDRQSETRYVPGTAGYAPMPAFRWYGGFYTYYSHWYPIMYSPGYYVTDKTYFLETNLYDADTEQLLWSAQTETVNPGSLDRFLQDYPAAVVNQMKKDGVLR